VQDGGLNMSGRYQELQNRFGIALLSGDLDPQAANALGLRFADRSVKPHQLYLYQVFAQDSTIDIAPGFSSILTTPEPIPQPVIDHLVEDEGYVNVKWRREDHEPNFTAYWIESSTDGRSYTRLNDVPFVGGETAEYPSPYFSYKHQVANYAPHHYRVVGLTPFGEASTPSESRIGMARDRTPPPEAQNLEVSCDAVSSIVTITWDQIESKDMHGVQVLRARSFDGEYRLAEAGELPPASVRFQEEVPDTRMIWFYKIAALDTAGNLNYSRIVQAAFRDTISPETPTGLSGSVDSNGIVRLHWDMGHEPDLRGYYVYMANQEDHYFTNMTPKPVLDTVWTDTITLKTFTEHIFYRVAAVDFHSHFSDWTEPLQLSKPDTLSPFPPAFVAYRVEKDHILLNCAPSRSKDVIDHVLERRKLPAGAWMPMEEFKMQTAVFADYQVEPGATYEYRLEAFDDAGLRSERPAVMRIKFVDQRRPEPPTISAQRSSETSITLTISPGDEKTTGYIIYRSVNAGSYTTLSRTGGTENFKDKSLLTGKQYAYKVRAVWNDGQKSDDSNIVHTDETQ